MGLFDTKKEQKSIKLVKKLQEQADLEWEKEVARRREQELNDEAIAKELQAQLEDEERHNSSSISSPTIPIRNNVSSSNLPPPLPTKPREYNNSTISFPSSSFSSRPITTTTTTTVQSNNRVSIPSSKSAPSLAIPTIKPLYKLPKSSTESSSSSSSQPILPPRKNTPVAKKTSYLSSSSQTYKPSVQFSLTSPNPSPASVFYQSTPALTSAAVPPQVIKQNAPSSSTDKNNSAPSSASSSSNNNGGSSNQLYNNSQSTSLPPPPSTEQAKPINHMAMPEPVDMAPSTSYLPVNSTRPTTMNNNHHSNISSSSYHEPIVLPLQPQIPQNFHVNNAVTSPQPFSHNNNNDAAAVNPSTFSQKPQQGYHQQQRHQNNTSPSYPTSTPFPTNYQEQLQQQQQQQQQQLNYGSYLNTPSNPNYYDNQQEQSKNYQHPPETQRKDSSTPLPLNDYAAPPQQIHTNSSYTAPLPPPVLALAPVQQHTVSAPVLPTTKSYKIPPHPVSNNSVSSSLPSQTSNAVPLMPINKQAAPPMSINKQVVPPMLINKSTAMSDTNPYYNKSIPQRTKKLYSDSVLSLKPDEDTTTTMVNNEDDEDDDWDNIVTAKTVTALTETTPLNKKEDNDNDSEIDYSDMIYDRRNESEPEEETDPFADRFAAVETKKEPSIVKTLNSTIQILDPTMTPLKVLSPKEDKVFEEKEAIQRNEAKILEEKKDITSRKKEAKIFEELLELHMYEEKKSEEVELPSPALNRFHTPLQDHRRQSYGTYLDHPVVTPMYLQQQHQASTSSVFHLQPSLQQQQQQQQQDDNYSIDSKDIVKVFPTNVVRAGAPPATISMSASNPYDKKQRVVPASDYGYYKENEPPTKSKILPELPKATSSEDRHITVASINPGQRVWIRIHPTDTGKMLAERIHIVASYQTRKVTKITTKNGRNIPLDNSSLFEDWNEIIHFKEGEAWTVEWVPIEHPYVDMITEGREFMKQLKANFRGSSSAAAAAADK